jgi:hypothetical protein
MLLRNRRLSTDAREPNRIPAPLPAGPGQRTPLLRSGLPAERSGPGMAAKGSQPGNTDFKLAC